MLFSPAKGSRVLYLVSKTGTLGGTLFHRGYIIEGDINWKVSTLFREIGCLCGAVNWNLVFVEWIMNVRFGRVYSLPSHLQVVMVMLISIKWRNGGDQGELLFAWGVNWERVFPEWFVEVGLCRAGQGLLTPSCLACRLW